MFFPDSIKGVAEHQGTFFKSNLEPSALQALETLGLPVWQKDCGIKVLAAGSLYNFFNDIGAYTVVADSSICFVFAKKPGMFRQFFHDLSDSGTARSIKM